MDWFPLYNSLRIALIASVIVFFTGIFAAYYIAKLHPVVKGVLDVVLTLPLVLPPTVVGYFILLLMGPRRPFGAWVLENFGTKLVMTWYSGIFAAAVVAFPLMYRTARGAFESFDETLAYSGQTLGLSNSFIFWRIRMPACRQGILAGAVLAFARPWASTEPPAWWQAIRRAGPRLSLPPSISCGGRTMTPWPSNGCW